MKRDEAIALLKDLEGQDLHALASQFGVTVVGASGKVNKGWAGHVCERYLGLPINSSRSPNFGSWELKSIPLKRKSDGSLAFKETMAITMIDPWEVKEKEFEDSHLYAKLRKAVCVARVVGKSYADPAFVHAVVPVDLKGEVLRQVQADYDEVRACLLDPNRGFEALTGRMGQLVQPRTKGAGHGSISRAFYARPAFLAQFITL
jgi:DNA mismatch repair protein MutH